MSEIFLKVLNMSISATYLVLAVLLLRLLIKKAPKWVSVLLWGIVAVRLICPVSVESILSLIPSGETVSPEIMMDWTPEIQTGISSLDSVVNPVISETFAPDPLTSANPLQILIPVAAVFWLTGVGIMLIYTAVSFLLLRRKVATAVRLRDRIYQSEKVASPFVLGIIRPKIYLPFAIDGQNMEHVIAHEMSHIRRRDHLWKPLGFLILTIHWFNPLMWIGYVFLCRDIELACDEKVIRKLDSDEKANYTQALVACSVGRLRIAACPLAFGEVGVKARVRSVMHYKKPAFWMIVAGIVISVAVAVCFLTNPKTKCYGETDREKLSDTQAALKGQYPAYFGLEATDGLDVYVWQMAGNSYSFGLKPHSKNHQEYLFDGWMDLKGISAAEMQEILATYPVEEEDIHIILWQHPLSSYLPEYCIVTEGENQEQKIAEHTEKIREMLFDTPVDGTEPTEENSPLQSGGKSDMDCAYIELTYHGNKDNVIKIEDKAVCAELIRMVKDARGQKAESTKGYYGVPYTLKIYWEGEEEPIKISVWNKDRFSTPELRDPEGYEFFIDGDLTELYNFLEEHYPADVWYQKGEQIIADGRVIMGEKYQTYKESFISLNIPLGWKCLERWGEDGRFLYFRDPIFGENCQLSIYSSGAMHYSHYTREDYMAHFTGYCGYEDVVIDSFSEETIQGFPCTKIVYSYTENNTRFVGIRYDSLNEGPRFYDFAITYPAAESKTYEEEFAAIIESVRFVKSNG